MTPRTRSLLATTLATLVLSGCSASPEAGPQPTSSPSASASPSTGSPSASQAAPATPAVPAAPKRSACYRLTPDQLTKPTNASSPVPCSGRHTAQTIYVGTLDTVVDGHAVAVDSTTVQKQLMETCPRKLDAYVGGSASTRDLSRFNVVWFSPTLEQSDQGADWFRCDVIAFAGRDRLVSLPGPRKLDGVLDTAKALDEFGLCGTSNPGAKGFERVVCGQRHSWRAVDTIALPGGSKYPGATAVRKAGNSDCKDLAQSRADDTLKFRYGWEWPTREQWERGQHFGYCWIPA